jgi:two-component system response regulator ResD
LASVTYNNRVVPLVLIADDEPNIIRILTAYLQREGFEVLTAGSGDVALELTLSRMPDLVVLDLMLPGLDGIEVCRQLRRRGDLPVLMLTARSDDSDKLVGLAVGADDYVTKPFNPAEVVARVQAILRRTRGPAAHRLLRAGPLDVDLDTRVATKGGRELELTALEFDLLATLLERPGVVWTRDQLLDRCWDSGTTGRYYGESRVVDVHVANLRKKIEHDPGQPELLRTVRGVGYKLVVP